MIENVLYDKLNTLRFGNLVYYCAYQFTKHIEEDYLHILTNSANFNEINYLFTNVKLDYCYNDKESFFCQVCDKILDSSLPGFDILKKSLNRKYLDNLNYNFDTSNIAVINIRLGDYLNAINNESYKFFNKHTFDKFISKYSDELNKYDNVVIVTNSKNIAEKLYTEILQKYLTTNIIFYSAIANNIPTIYDFNLLLKAKFIIGSCSTFSFAGCVLNYNNAKMIVEYPYYKQPNTRLYKEDKQKELYNHPNIIKEC